VLIEKEKKGLYSLVTVWILFLYMISLKRQLNTVWKKKWLI